MTTGKIYIDENIRIFMQKASESDKNSAKP
jgi:hypothetical protein